MIIDIAGILVFYALLTVLALFTGRYIAGALAGKRVWLTPVMGPVERLVYRLININETREQSWKAYAFSVVMVTAVSILGLYAILRLQGVLPLNPEGRVGVEPLLALNIAISFATNTNWQAYSGEQTLSHFTQMAGLAVQNFLSAAVGIAVAAALVRGIARKGAATIGNCYVDIVRAVLYILLPLSLVAGLFLASQGVPQHLGGFQTVTALEGQSQTIASGPMASMLAIKNIGTNGGGFLNANAAHPFENPTVLTNLVSSALIFLLPMALVFAYGVWMRDSRQAWTLYGALTLLVFASMALMMWSERLPNVALTSQLEQAGITLSGVPNMEGKEHRFGDTLSLLWAEMTTATSCGAVNAAHDSLTPLSGLVVMTNMLLGEVIFGGAGSGLYGLLVFVILTVFLAGLMVGRSPEYLGKKIEVREITLAILLLLVMPLGALVAPALALMIPEAAGSIQDAGPHGFSELLYAYASAIANNGSAFGGFNANTPFHNVMLGISMFIGRVFCIIPVLAIAGSLAAKNAVEATAGTFPTHGVQFALLVLGVILIVGGLTFFPALVLGPIAEHFAWQAGTVY